MLHRLLPFQPSKTEFKLFIVYALLIIYGTLYPFNFQLQEVPLHDLLKHYVPLQQIDLDDMGFNLVLFMPFGFLGVRAMRSPFLPDLYSLGVTLCCVPLAFGLQFLQIMIPSRVPSLLDMLLNILGCGLAAAVGASPRFRFFWGKRGMEHWKSIPLFLALCWVGYLLAPFLPSLEPDLIMKSLKPLWPHPEFSFLSTLLYLTGWTVFAQALSEHMDQPLRPWKLLVIMFHVWCGQILIMHCSITVSHVIASLIACMFWALMRQRTDQARIKILFALLLLTVSLRGLHPFELTQSAYMDFHFLPFTGFLEGSRKIDLPTLFQKVFLYGSIIWFLELSGTSSRNAFLLCLAWITLIEVAQLWYIRHTPELTDMILVLATSLMIKEVGQSQAPQVSTYEGPERRETRFQRESVA